MIALVSVKDKLHTASEKIFKAIDSNKLKNVHIPSSAYLEYELILKSKGVDGNKILKEIVFFQNINNIGEIPLDSKIIVTSIKLREKFQLSYFDSLHVASSMFLDSIIIGTDKDYQKLPHITLLDPRNV
jgi:predicted nucleic acid-binding protein